MALGFYFQELVTLLFVDDRMKDFYVMLAHHLVTVYLIVFSLASGYCNF